MFATEERAVAALLGAHYIIHPNVNCDTIRRQFNVCIVKFTCGNTFQVLSYVRWFMEFEFIVISKKMNCCTTEVFCRELVTIRDPQQLS
jgi:hypothetical protein